MILTRYKCDECDGVFEEPGRYTVYSEYWGAPGQKEETCCPFCGEENFHEMSRREIQEMEGEEYA